jgi:hypothetical protein
VLRCCILSLLVALGGCASQQQIQERQAAANAAIDADGDAKCRSFGLEPGSPGYVQCRMTLNQTRTQTDAAQEVRGQEAYSRVIDENPINPIISGQSQR